MADFRIKLDTSLDSSKAKSDFETLKKHLEGEGVKLGIDVSKFKSDMNTIKTALNNAFKLDGKQNNGLDKIMSTMKEINKLSKGMQNNLFGGKENTSSIDRTMKKYDQLMAKKQTLDKQLNSMKVGNLSSEQAKQIDKLRNTLKGFDKFSIDTSDIAKSEEDMRNFENTLKEVKKSLGDMNVDLSFTKQFDKAQKDVEELTRKLSKLKTQNVDGKFIDTGEIDKATSKLKELSKIKITPDMDNATGELREYINEIEKCQTAYKNMNNTMSANKSSMNSINSSISGSKKLFNDFYTSIAAYSIGDMLADGIISGARKVKDTVVEMDSAFRDLSKVAPESYRGTASEINSLKNSAISAGQEVAKSSVDIISSTANALQSGFKSIDDAMKYAKESAKFSNVADMSQEDTDKSLRSVLSSYGGVENALKGTRTQIQGATKDYSMMNRIMDASNYMGNNYSTSTKSIAEGLQNTGSALKTMNVGLEDGMAYFVAIDEVMQNSEKSSNGLKAIAMNMTGITVSAKDGSLGLNKSAKALKNFADIDVQKPNGELRDMGSVLDELGGKWKTLNDTQQQALMIAIGGKHRSPQMSALMENWDTVKKIQQEIGSGMAIGSADKENERFVNSLEGKLNRLSEAMKKLVTTTVTSDMFGGLIDGATSVINTINNVISVFDKLGITTPVVASSIAGMFMGIKAMATGSPMTNLTKSLVPKTWNSLANTFDLVGNSATKTIPRVSKLSSTMGNTNKNVTKLSNSTSKYSGNMRTVNKGLSSVKASSVAANIGVSLLNTTIMALAGVGISLAIKGIDNFVNKQEKLAEASRDRQATIKSEIDSTKQQVSGLSSISKEYDKLANKTNKSKKEMERFNELKNEIATISPDLVLGYDGDNNPILAINGSLERTIALKKEMLKLDEEILQAEKKQEVQANRDKNERLWESQGKNSSDFKGDGKTPNGKTTDWTQSQVYSKDVDSYRKSLEDKSKAYNEYINKQSKIRSEYNERELKAQQVALTDLNTTLGGKNLNDKTVQNINSIAGSFNWGNLSAGETQKVITGFEGLNNEFGKFNVETIQKGMSNLAMDFEAGSISSKEYNDEIEQLASKLNKAGVDIDKGTLKKALKQFPPELKEIQYETASMFESLNESLNLDLKLSDIGTDNFATMLATQLGNVKSLTQKFAADMEGDNVIDIKLLTKVSESELYNQLPGQIQEAIDTVMKDGKVTEQESEILMKMTTTWEQDGEINLNDFERLMELNGQEFTTEMRTKLKSEMDEDYRKYVINNTQEGKSLESTITAKFKAEGQNEYKSAYQKAGVDPNSKEGKKITNEIDAKFQQRGFEASKNVAGVMTSLGLTSGKQQSKFLAAIEAEIKTGNLNLDTLKDAQGVLDWLQSNPDIAKKVGLTVDENGNIEEVAKYIKEMQSVPDETKKSVTVESQGADEAQNKINTLNGSSIHDFVFSTTDQGTTGKVQGKVSNLNNTKLKDKIQKILETGAGVVLRQLSSILGVRLPSKTQTVIDSGGKGVLGTLNSIFSKPSEKKVTVTTVMKTIKQTISSIFGGGGKPSESSFVEESIPSPMSEGMASPMARTPVVSDTPTETPQVSTRSASNFGGILTSSTLSTKLVSSYKNILNMIKYGVNLFQELENRIERVGNQVKLLDLQMENAVGTKKIKHLETQNKLYNEQLKLQKSMFNALTNERKALKGKVQKYGFKVNDQGNLTNYEETLSKLEGVYESAKKKEESYTGKSESYKKKLSKATDTANKKLEEAKKYSEEYLDVFNDKLPQAEQEWQKLQNQIKENKDLIEQLKFEDKIYKEQHAIGELNNSYEQYLNYLDRAGSRKDLYEGDKKLKYMKQEIEYSNKLLEIQEKLKEQYKSERKDYKGQLKKYNVQFDSSTGQINNYDETLNKYKNSSDYDKIKKWMDEYNELLMAERDATNNIEDFKNSIQDLNNEIKIFELEQKISAATNSIGNANQKIQKLNNQLSLIDVKLQNASGIDKVNLLDEQIRIWGELKKLQENNLKQMQSGLNIYQDELKKYGFSFDSLGNMTNMESKLDALKDSANYDYIKDTIDKWKELYNDSIPNAEQSLEEYNNAIKDANNTKLEIAKSVEDKITEMIKSQLEKRKEAIRKQADEEIKLINKRKDAYNKMREEANYKDDYDEQMKKINKLKQQIEIAQRDDSLSGKAKLEELLEQLDEENKNLQDLVQEKVDKDINDMLDKESENIQENADKEIENLDNEWTESKIAEAVKNALADGVFEDVEGNIVSLKDAMLEFAKESGDAFGVMGDKIKNELLNNLVIAQDVIKDLADIYKDLEIPMSNVSVPKQEFNGRSSVKQVSVGDSYFNISGNVDSDTMRNIEKLIDDKNNKLIKYIESRI